MLLGGGVCDVFVIHMYPRERGIPFLRRVCGFVRNCDTTKEAEEERRWVSGIGPVMQTGKFECDKVVEDESGNESLSGSAGTCSSDSDEWLRVHGSHPRPGSNDIPESRQARLGGNASTFCAYDENKHMYLLGEVSQ